MRTRRRPAGWRTLFVGDLEVWWIVGTPRVDQRAIEPTTDAIVQSIEIAITAIRADRAGAKLVATVRGKRALAVPSAGFVDVQSIAVTPETVRVLVETAAPGGAWPEAGTWHTELELPQQPLPQDLTFRPEHLERLEVVWTAR